MATYREIAESGRGAWESGRLRGFFLLILMLPASSCVVDVHEHQQEVDVPGTLRLHPRDTRYLEFRGKPVVLVTSAEHYGAVLNLDFDYRRYLTTLHEAGLNYTRIFTGTYVERQSSFGIKHNTLAPASGRLIAPWARSDRPGYVNGGNRFDLEKWDESYFERLRDFVGEAGSRDIVVEVTLFSSIYQDGHWDYSPLHPDNNINLDGPIDRRLVHTLANGPLLGVQERLVRKLVRELNPFDNVFFEIQNEPYADHPVTAAAINSFLPDWREEWRNRVDLAGEASLNWQRKVAEWVSNEEASLPLTHLIAQNFSNFRYPLAGVDQRVSILNFHYAYPEAVAMNSGYARVIGFDESGFSGSEDDAYRRQAWRFILAGGGIFNNLDYSFYPGFEDGTGRNEAPGGGGPSLRKQLSVLKTFIHDFDFVRMSPTPGVVRLAPGCNCQVLSNRARDYAIFVEGESNCELELSLPPGEWRAEWINTRTGEVERDESFIREQRTLNLKSPAFEGDIALKIRRID